MQSTASVSASLDKMEPKLRGKQSVCLLQYISTSFDTDNPFNGRLTKQVGFCILYLMYERNTSNLPRLQFQNRTINVANDNKKKKDKSHI